MKHLVLTALCSILTLTAGCLPSLYPLYTETDLIFDPQLVGLWQEEEDEMLWIFESKDQKTYGLTIIDDEEKSSFDAHLLILGDRTYLDLYPQDLSVESAFYAAHFVKTHTFYRIVLSENSFEIASIDVDFLKRLMEERQLPLEIFNLEENACLAISPTPELQNLILEFRDFPGFWETPSVMTGAGSLPKD
jgi:hypothetical protein